MSLRLIANGQTFTKIITFTSRYAASTNAFVNITFGDGVVYTTHSASKGIFDGSTWTIGSLALNEVVTLELQITVVDYTQLLRVSWEGFADVDRTQLNNSGVWNIDYDFACADLDPCIPAPQLLSYEIGTHTLSISNGNSVVIPNTEYRLNLDGHQVQLTDIVGSIISFIDLPDEAFDAYTISINGNYLRLIKNGTTIVSNIMMPTYTLSGAGSTVYLTNNLTGAVSQYTVPSSGGADGSITLVELDGADLNFTGINGGFNGTVDVSALLVDTNTTYTLQLVSNSIRLVDNAANIISTIPLPVDTNTTYTLSRSGLTLTLTPSSGPAQNVTLPDISITDTQPTGKTIATVTKLAGTTNTIKETITGIEYDVDGNPSYVDEEGNLTAITVSPTSLPDGTFYQLDLMHSESLPILLKHLNSEDPVTATSCFVIPDYIANYEDAFTGQWYWLKEWTVVAKNLNGIDAGGNVTLKLRHIDGQSLATFTGTDDTIVVTLENTRYFKNPYLALKTGAAADPLANTALLGFMVEIDSDPGNRIDENSEIHITLYYERGYVV